MEICLGVQPVMQPSPNRNPGGDCFACALTAVLRYVHQRPDIPFDACYDFFVPVKSQTPHNSWPGMRAALYTSIASFGEIEIYADVVRPDFEPETWSHAFGNVLDGHRWARLLEAYLRAGWVALTEINHAGAGPVIDGKWNVTDHFVVLDGIRHFWQRRADLPGCASLDAEVHVVCSARGSYWQNVREFQFKHGGNGWWLVRKDARDYRDA